MDIRNIAIIAHVDHGKTTLVDELLKQSGAFRANQNVSERVMDSNDLERERGITILAKATSVEWKETRINIVDTPGHADFGGEVERILNMVDGVVLLVDAAEGPMPQTKFVTSKALNLGLRPIVVLNKVDKSDAEPDRALDECFDLFASLDANEDQLDFPHMYASGRSGLTGRIESGQIKGGATVQALSRIGQKIEQFRITKILAFRGLSMNDIDEATAGDIVSLAGMNKSTVSDTLCALAVEEPIEALPIDPPTISVTFGINDSPLAGREGNKVQSRVIRERLFKEAESNVAIKVTETPSGDAFEVAGRGELQMGVLIENMRREGFELSISRPQVLIRKDENGKTLEPIEEVTIDVDDEYSGAVIEKITGARRGDLIEMRQSGANKTRIIAHVPSRGLIGYHGEFLTDTRGTGILNRVFHNWSEYKGAIPGRRSGVLISIENGETVAYALWNLEERGRMFLGPQTKVYEGMILGEHNPLKGKKLTNVRASGSDEAVRLTPHIKFSLEEAIAYIDDDELVEVTPMNIRLRKRYLDPHERKRKAKQGTN